MAIERKSKMMDGPISYDTKMEDQERPGEDESGSGEPETTDIPDSLLEGQSVQPGDVIRLEVVSANPDSGTVTVKYATDTGSDEGGIDNAASKFEA